MELPTQTAVATNGQQTAGATSTSLSNKGNNKITTTTSAASTSSSSLSANKKVILYNPNVDYSAPLQQEINAELIGSHPQAQQYQKSSTATSSQQQQSQVRQSSARSSTSATSIYNNSTTSGVGLNNTPTTSINNLQLKLSEQQQCNLSKLGNINSSSTTTTNNSNNNNFNMNEFNAMKISNNIVTTTSAIIPPTTATQAQPQTQHLLGPGPSQLGLLTNNETTINNSNSINNLLCSNNLNTKVWSSQQPQNICGGLYQTANNSTFQMDNLNNHCTEAMISSLWGSESSSSGCSSGSGSQPSLSPTLMNNGSNNYRSNSKESLWSQQTSPSTSSTGCSSQLRDTYYTGSKIPTNTSNQSPTSWSSHQQQQQQHSHTNQQQQNEMNFSKMNNIWEISQNNQQPQDLFPEIWTNLSNNNNHNLTDNISDISSNTSSQQDNNDIWRSPQLGQTGQLKSEIRPLFGNTNHNLNENNHSGLGAAACMQLFSDEFLFM